MSEVWIGAISALLGSIVGAIVVMFQTYFSYKEKQEERRERIIFKGIDRLNRDEVERSIGISIIEGLKIEDKDELDIVIPALASQALFLLLHTKKNKSRVEFSNWLRIMELLKSPEWLDENYPYLWEELANAFVKKMDNDTEYGIEMASQTLNMWASSYGVDVESHGAFINRPNAT
ncbi:MAG TPA: hypothetical protein VF181_00955 [Balneolaceae bacterium]